VADIGYFPLGFITGRKLNPRKPFKQMHTKEQRVTLFIDRSKALLAASIHTYCSLRSQCYVEYLSPKLQKKTSGIIYEAFYDQRYGNTGGGKGDAKDQSTFRKQLLADYNCRDDANRYMYSYYNST
jgi:hypothetical protein